VDNVQAATARCCTLEGELDRLSSVEQDWKRIADIRDDMGSTKQRLEALLQCEQSSAEDLKVRSVLYQLV
jgi:hypothetical protein